MDKGLDNKSYWKCVKAKRDAKVADGMEKNQAFKAALKELNTHILALCDYAGNFLQPV